MHKEKNLGKKKSNTTGRVFNHPLTLNFHKSSAPSHTRKNK